MLLFARLRNEEFLDLLSGIWLLSQKIVKAFAGGCPLSQRINILDKNTSTYPKLGISYENSQKVLRPSMFLLVLPQAWIRY